MIKAIIFENEIQEWFIDWADPNEIDGPYMSLDEALVDYRRAYPDLPNAYQVQPYSQTMEWA